MGAIIKHLGARYPAQQLSMLRNVFGLIPSALVLFYSRDWRESGRPVRLVQWKLAIARGGFVTIAQFCFYLSLIHLEFATASTIAFFRRLVCDFVIDPDTGSSSWHLAMVSSRDGFCRYCVGDAPGCRQF